MNKPKRDPEKELFRRKALDFILFGTLIVFLLSILVLAVLMFISAGIYLFHELSTSPELEPFLELLKGFAGFIFVIAFFYGVVSYGAWNDKRMEELKKIVESEDSTRE